MDTGKNFVRFSTKMKISNLIFPKFAQQSGLHYEQIAMCFIEFAAGTKKLRLKILLIKKRCHWRPWNAESAELSYEMAQSIFRFQFPLFCIDFDEINCNLLLCARGTL